MLINLSRYMPVTIDPSKHPTTLAIRLDAPDEHPECGVFAGRHQAFEEHEEGKLAPLLDAEEYGLKTFLIDRPHKAVPSCCSRWAYVAIGWDDGVYSSHPYVHNLTIEESNGDDGHYWAVHLGLSSRGPGITIVLPDYKPGALARVHV